MEIHSIKESNIFLNYLPMDDNLREINIYRLQSVTVVGDCFYPNILLNSNGEIYNPIDEKIMSLENVKLRNRDLSVVDQKNIERNPVFFFIHNTDNYYHFVYDTLPYLISYFHLKETIPNLKLLMNYPNHHKNNFYDFVIEFLEILNISEREILIVNKETMYDEVYISSSYTHGENSNKPPREEIYSFYKKIVSNVRNKSRGDIQYPKKIYISRRSWIHNDFSNIGTNYTTRRKLVNEDELVDFLVKQGYKEIFTENLTTVDKINLFDNVESIVGAIGGGLCNALFAKETSKLLVLLSPTFLEVNTRFIYSFQNIDTIYYNDSKHIEENEWKKYMRVCSVDGIIGEIEEVYENSLLISYTNKFVAGWNNDGEYNRKIIDKKDCLKLDNGLNSSWSIDLKNLKKKYN